MMNLTYFESIQQNQTRCWRKLPSLLLSVWSASFCLLGASLTTSSLANAITQPAIPETKHNQQVIVTTTYSMADVDKQNLTTLTPTKPAPQEGQALHLTYPSAVRLEQVLADSLIHLPQLPVPDELNNQPIYWQGAGLYIGFPHPNKSTVLASLDALKDYISASTSSNRAHDIAVIQSLHQTLSYLAIGERVFTPLDYDAVRIIASANPLITQAVTLVLPPRPTGILVLGAVEKPGVQSWLPRQTANFYLAQAHPSSQGVTQAANSIATIIQPDGHVETHPIAYWNQNHHDISPGATVYINFADLPDRVATLNDEIVTLLRNRAL